MAIQINGKKVVHLGSMTIPIIKGDVGPEGKQGIPGIDGKDGVTPLRGIDYWTTEDKTEIINEIDNKVQEDLKSYYLKSETYNKEEIDNKISLIPKFDIKVVDKLPTENIEEATVYLVKSGEESNNLYTEYIYTNGKWEQLGTQKLDLSGFYNKDEINAMFATRDSKITALEEENRSQADRIKELEEEVEILSGDYKEKEIQGETVYILDGLTKSKVPVKVNGNSYQETTEGYNILPTNKNKWESGHYDTNGNKTNFDTRMRLIDLLPIEPSSTYYCSKLFILRGFNANKELVQNIGIVDATNTFTTNSDVVYLGVATDITYSNYIEETDKLLICLNSVTNKTWEPYTGGQASPNIEYKQDIEVITECSLVQRGKNYFNKDNANIVGGKFSESGFEEGQITSNKTCYVKIKPNKTITVSKVLSSKFAVATATDIPKNNVIPTTFIRKDSNIDITVTSGINDNYLWVWFWNKDNDTNILEDLLNSIQIEDGTENTDYEPYIEPIVHSIDLAGEKLAKVGEIADLLNIGVDGSCRINKNIKEKIFNGLEEFTNVENANGVRYFTNVNLIPDNASNDILCTHLKHIADLWNLTEQIDCIKVSANIKSQFNLMVKGFNDSSQLIAKLKELYDNETPMKLLYATSEPQTINLPSIEPITLFEGTNIFELVTNLRTTMKAEYKISNNARLEALEKNIGTNLVIALDTINGEVI